MIETERFYRTLVLTVLFSFFLFSLSFLSVLFSNSLGFLISGTFLNSFVDVNDIIIGVVLNIIRYTSFIFFAGALIALIVIFFVDWLFKPTKISNTM